MGVIRLLLTHTNPTTNPLAVAGQSSPLLALCADTWPAEQLAGQLWQGGSKDGVALMNPTHWTTTPWHLLLTNSTMSQCTTTPIYTTTNP